MAIDLEKYRKQLIEERDRLNKEIPTVAEAAEPTPDDRQITAANAAVIGEIKDVQNRVIEIKSDRLERVRAALQSIDDGTYGTCIRCGKPIDPRRLDAEPTAITCMDCLNAEERDFKSATM
jgi:RNA polymerase-binding transcription factor DksA